MSLQSVRAFFHSRDLQTRIIEDEVVALTSHPVGGLCTFGLPQPLPVYLDHTPNDVDEVLPAAGSINSAIRITPALMATLTEGRWVDVCGSAA